MLVESLRIKLVGAEQTRQEQLKLQRQTLGIYRRQLD